MIALFGNLFDAFASIVNHRSLAAKPTYPIQHVP